MDANNNNSSQQKGSSTEEERHLLSLINSLLRAVSLQTISSSKQLASPLPAEEQGRSTDILQQLENLLLEHEISGNLEIISLCNLPENRFIIIFPFSSASSLFHQIQQRIIVYA